MESVNWKWKSYILFIENNTADECLREEVIFLTVKYDCKFAFPFSSAVPKGAEQKIMWFEIIMDIKKHAASIISL